MPLVVVVVAAAMVPLLFSIPSLALRLKGVLHDGVAYDSAVDSDPASVIGRLTTDGWWVKCRGKPILPNGTSSSIFCGPT